MKKLFFFLSVTVILLTFTAISYAAGPWKGRVVDAETGQPIEGAAVVAVWEKILSSPAGEQDMFLYAVEVVTDKNGEFEIPSKHFLSIPLIRKVQGPAITIYKPGYGSFPKHRVTPRVLTETTLVGKGATVELPRIERKLDRYYSMIDAELSPAIPEKWAPVLNELIKKEKSFLEQVP